MWEGSSGTKTVVLYPGESASSPAMVGANQRIVVGNPWPGHYLLVEAQVRVGSRWGWAGHFGNWSSVDHILFLHAKQLLPDGTIFVQSAMHGVSATPNVPGSPFGDDAWHYSVPWHLVVTRLGRIT